MNPQSTEITNIGIQHVSRCLSSAQKMINVIHSAFTHRHYFRTWWYNATHTVYASVIICYILLSGRAELVATEGDKEIQIAGVNKSLQILRAMDVMPIAARYAGLLEEILEVIKQPPGQYERGRFSRDCDTGNTQSQSNDLNAVVGASIVSKDPGPPEDVPQPTANEQISQDVTAVPHLQDAGLARNDLLASLMNPTALDGFATGQEDIMFDNVDGWNVSGYLCSDFNFNGGEDAGAELRDWSECQ
jgi:hypothetical protein